MMSKMPRASSTSTLVAFFFASSKAVEYSPLAKPFMSIVLLTSLAVTFSDFCSKSLLSHNGIFISPEVTLFIFSCLLSLNGSIDGVVGTSFFGLLC